MGQNAMSKAVECVKNGAMGTLKASKSFGVPRTTLQRLAKSDDHFAVKKLGSKVPVFPEHMEAELVEHILTMEQSLFGVTIDGLRHVVYQFAETNDLEHPFNRENECAGKEWLRGFL